MGVGTGMVKEGGVQEAKVIRVARVATKEPQEVVQAEASKEVKEVTEEDLSLRAKGPVTGVAKKVTSGKIARSRPTRLTAAKGGASPDPQASSSPAATPLKRRAPLRRRQEEVRTVRKQERSRG